MCKKRRDPATSIPFWSEDPVQVASTFPRSGNLLWRPKPRYFSVQLKIVKSRKFGHRPETLVADSFEDVQQVVQRKVYGFLSFGLQKSSLDSRPVHAGR